MAKNRTRKQIKPPQRYAYANLAAYALSVVESIENEEPKTYHEVITSRETTQWIVAMNEEIESLQKNHTWQQVEKPKNKKIVGCKWLFKRKEGISGVENARFKAHLVGKGLHTKGGCRLQ